MSLLDMMAELRGTVPKFPISFAKTAVNRAWRVVRESTLWSFNLQEFSWISPPLVSAGTVNIVQGATTGTFDATALAALNASSASYSLITQRQFRAPFGGIYNIILFNAGTGAFTLDRMYGDPGGAAIGYQVYQVYYTPLTADFLTPFSVRNPQMFMSLNIKKNRQWLDGQDPQRTWYQFPTHVIKYGIDLRAGSSTLNFPLYELWGQPVQLFTYQVYGIRRGADLVNPGDTLPPQIGEDLVLAKAKEYVYEWAEANKGSTPRNAGPDYKFLMGASDAEYKDLLKMYRRQDREVVSNYMSQSQSDYRQVLNIYSTLSGYATP